MRSQTSLNAETGPCSPVYPRLDSLIRDGIYVHALPGRLRVEAPALRSDPGLGERIRAVLSRSPGVTAVEINERTGRVLIQFDPSEITEDEIAALLHRAGCFLALPDGAAWGARESSAAHTAGQALARLAAEALARHTIEWIFASLF